MCILKTIDFSFNQLWGGDRIGCNWDSIARIYFSPKKNNVLKIQQNGIIVVKRRLNNKTTVDP